MRNKFKYLILLLFFILCIVGCNKSEKVLIKMITFNGTEVLYKEVETGSKITSLPTPEKDGYEFGGWYYDYDFVNKVTFPFSVSQETTLYAGWFNYLNYELNEATDTYTVTGVNFPTADIVVPSEFKGKVVDKIARSAFEASYLIKTITLPDTITEIGDYAFLACTNLEFINLPDSLDIIGIDIFEGCEKLYYKSERGLKYINNWLVDGTKAEMSNGVLLDNTVGIFPGAFYGNETLKEFTIPNNVKKIYSDTFKESSIEKINISKNVEYIDYTAFSFTNNLKEINVVEDNNHFKSIENVLYNKDVTELILYPSNRENPKYTIPSSVEKVYDRACMYNEYLQELTLSSNLKVIGNQSFFGLSSLSVVNFNSVLESIGKEAFAYSPNIEKLLLPSTVKEIGENAFKNLNKVEELSVSFVYNKGTKYSIKYLFGGEDIPETLVKLFILGGDQIPCDTILGIHNVEYLYIGLSINYIEEGALIDGTSISTIEIDQANSKYKSVNNVVYSKDNKQLLFYSSQNKQEEFTVPSGVEIITKYAFNSNPYIQAIVLNSGLNNISQNAFYNLSLLRTLIVPSTVNHVGQDMCFITPKVTVYVYSGVSLDNWSEGWNTMNYPVVWNAIFPTFHVSEREFHIEIDDVHEIVYTVSNAPSEYEVEIYTEDTNIVKLENNNIIGLSDGIAYVYLKVVGYPTSEYVIIVHVGKA